MTIIKNIFGKDSSDEIIYSLGNMILSGSESPGYDKLYFNMLTDFLHENKTVIMLNGSISEERNLVLTDFINSHIDESHICRMNYSEESDTIDILSAFDTPVKKADFIVELLSMSAEIPTHIKSKAKRYYSYVIHALEAKSEKYKLKDIYMMDIEDVAESVSTSTLSEPEKTKMLRFLTDTSMYSIYLDLDSAMANLKEWGLMDMFSGERGLKDVLNDGNTLIINGFLEDDFKLKELLFNALIYAITKCIEKYRSDSKIVFFMKNADFLSGDHMKNILKYNKTYSFAAYTFVEDVSNFVAKNGNTVLDTSKSFLVFQQGSDTNARFWSDFFGSREFQERSYSFTTKKSWNPITNMMDSSGVVSMPRRYKTATQNFQKVNKPIYRPEVFRELKSNEVMIYLREPLMRKKVRMEE